MTTDIHATIARNAYTLESLCRGYTEDETDSIAQDCADMALHALAILRERAGTAPHASIAQDAARVESIRNFLRIIMNAAARVEAAFAAGGDR